MRDREVDIAIAKLSLDESKHALEVARAEYTAAAKRLRLAGDHVVARRNHLDNVRNK